MQPRHKSNISYASFQMEITYWQNIMKQQSLTYF